MTARTGTGQHQAVDPCRNCLFRMFHRRHIVNDAPAPAMDPLRQR